LKYQNPAYINSAAPLFTIDAKRVSLKRIQINKVIVSIEVKSALFLGYSKF